MTVSASTSSERLSNLTAHLAPTSSLSSSAAAMAPSSSSSFSSASSRGQLGSVLQLVPGVQKYEWGLLGEDRQRCLVANYAQATAQLDFKREDKTPYAELWMGTHPKVPSLIVPSTSAASSSSSSSLQTLSSHLNTHPALLGSKIVSKFGTGVAGPSSSLESAFSAAQSSDARDTGALPFLFKILSIGKALSIQAHPDKKLAKRLNRESPKMYTDDNHKPEMAIALTPFKGFCGFRPLSEISYFLSHVEEYASVVDAPASLVEALNRAAKQGASEEEGKKLVKDVFERLMRADEKRVAKEVSALARRYEEALSSNSSSLEVDEDVARLVVQLNKEYPYDVGVFCTFVLNVLSLDAGQAMFLRANEPHAYLEGNIVECMAASDNVVRAGLTPKQRDVDTLVDMLTYDYGKKDQLVMRPRPFFPHEEDANRIAYEEVGEGEVDFAELVKSARKVPSLLYDPPIDEFAVVLTRLGTRLGMPGRERQRALHGPSVLIVTAGKGRIVSHEVENGEESTFPLDEAGKVFFIAEGTSISLEAEGDKELVTYRAFVEC